MPGVVGIISIALLNGWFIALSTQAALIAAVITGSLGLMLTAAYFIYTSNEKQEAHIYCYWSFGVFLFCMVLFCSYLFWRDQFSERAEQLLIEELKKLQNIHFEYLNQCSEFQVIINEQREILELSPLSNEIVCSSPFNDFLK